MLIPQSCKKQSDSLVIHKSQLILVLISVLALSDIARHLKRTQSGAQLTAWASWIGEVPTAAEMYGESSSDAPSNEAFDDDEEDEELDASATNEYPDNENDNDETYEDADDAQDNAESRTQEHWLRPSQVRKPSVRLGGHSVWTNLEGGWRRNKRDIEDRIKLASRRAAQRHNQDQIAAADDAEFTVDDGDEDAWVHDGIDDIHIDPETKRAASELSYDEKSIEADYEPHQSQQDSPIVNRTRITTITDVIPMNVDEDDSIQDRDSTRVSPQLSLPPGMPTGSSVYLPAAYLSLNQLQTLLKKQQSRRSQPS